LLVHDLKRHKPGFPTVKEAWYVNNAEMPVLWAGEIDLEDIM
jgi:hypothetical protein